MKIREMFKMVSNYNKIGRMMNAYHAHITFGEVNETLGFVLGGEVFDDYEEFRDWVKYEYQKEIADDILKRDDWDFDTDITVKWAGGTCVFTAEVHED